MSRNLCDTRCYRCKTTPKLAEKPREVTEKDVGPYYSEYQGMLVALAICPVCGARYLAWVRSSHKLARAGYHMDCSNPRDEWDDRFFDLSFYSTFNDEPGEEDLPEAWIHAPKGSTSLEATK